MRDRRIRNNPMAKRRVRTDKSSHHKGGWLDRALGMFALLMFVCGLGLIAWLYLPAIAVGGDGVPDGLGAGSDNVVGPLQLRDSEEYESASSGQRPDSGTDDEGIRPPGEDPPPPPNATKTASEADAAKIAAEFDGEPLPLSALDGPATGPEEQNANGGAGPKAPGAEAPGAEAPAADPPDSLAADSGQGVTPGRGGGSAAPADKSLGLSVPGMERVDDLTVHDAAADDHQALADSAIHLESTGFPWEEEANVYIAGHRLGYKGTDSHLVFWDLDELRSGDEIEVSDSAGRDYTYRVYETEVVDPSDTSAAAPVPGKNILTLQTCTLPDYSERLLVRAEKVSDGADSSEPTEDGQHQQSTP